MASKIVAMEVLRAYLIVYKGQKLPRMLNIL